MRKYVPRRAGKRWLESAPDYILDCFDNGGDSSCDRYTVCFAVPLTGTTFSDMWLAYLGMSDDPHFGFSQWGELMAYQMANYRQVEAGRKHRIRWLDLPKNVRKHVVERWEPNYLYLERLKGE